jgi:hypothetical protein
MGAVSTIFSVIVFVQSSYDSPQNREGAIFGALFAYLPPTLAWAIPYGAMQQHLCNNLVWVQIVTLLGVEVMVSNFRTSFMSLPSLIGASAVGLYFLGAAARWPSSDPTTSKRIVLLRVAPRRLFCNLAGTALLCLVIFIAFLRGSHSAQPVEMWLLVAGLAGAAFGLGTAAVHTGLVYNLVVQEADSDGSVFGGSISGIEDRRSFLIQDGLRIQMLAAILFLAPFFLWPLLHHQNFLLVGLLLGGGTVLFVSVRQRNRDVIFLTSSVMVLAFWVHFFIGTHNQVPLWLPLTIFGVLMLAFGVFYEYKLKHTIKALWNWPSAFDRGLGARLLQAAEQGPDSTTELSVIQPQSSSPGGLITLQVTVPQSYRAGQKLAVQTPVGIVEAEIPQGCGPGGTFRLQVPVTGQSSITQRAASAII